MIGSAVGVVAPAACAEERKPERSPTILARVLSVSDVSGMPDVPLARGSLLLIPWARLGALEEAVGADALDSPAARYAAFRIGAAELEVVGGAGIEIGSRGTVAIGEARGRYLACLANIRPDDAAGPPFRIVGCGALLLADGSPPTITFGEGGVEVTPAPGRIVNSVRPGPAGRLGLEDAMTP